MKNLLPLLVWLGSLYGGWALLWGAHERWLAQLSPGWELLFWTLAKLLVWFGPALLWLRSLGVPALEGLGITRPTRAGVGWGLFYSALWLALCEGQVWAGTPRPTTDTLTLAHGSAVLVAPLLEELLFRGFLRGRLRALGLGAWATVLLCAALFALLHLPGWIATGRYAGLEVLRELGGLTLTGLCFGLVRERGGVICAAVPLHFVNNLWSSGVLGYLLR